jgi:hypothetical protein
MKTMALRPTMMMVPKIWSEDGAQTITLKSTMMMVRVHGEKVNAE